MLVYEDGMADPHKIAALPRRVVWLFLSPIDSMADHGETDLAPSKHTTLNDIIPQGLGQIKDVEGGLRWCIIMLLLD